MIKLNLLPPEEKKILSLEQSRRWVNFYGCSGFLMLAAFSLLLIFIWSLILIQLKGSNLDVQSNQASQQGRSVSEQQNSVKELNRTLQTLDAVQKNQRYFSKFLIFLAENLPSGMRLDGLAVEKNGRVALSGFAPRREQLLLFQRKIEDSSLFSDIENPLENLTRQTDINFTIEFSLKPEVLKQ